MMNFYHDIETALENNAEYLALDGGDWTELPEDLCKLKRLKRLYLRNIPLEKLPENIEEFFPKLQHFKIENSNLKRLPETVCHLSKLTHLAVTHSQLESIPYSIGILKLLKELSFEHNKLKNIPANLKELKSLQQLRLAHNNLTKIPDAVCTSIPYLSVLDLRNNQLEEFPYASFHAKRKYDIWINEHLTGTLNQDDLWKLIKKMQRQKIAVNRRKLYFHIASKQLDILKDVSTQDLLQATTSKITNVALSAVDYLTKQSKPTQQGKTLSIAIPNKTNLRKNKLKKRLEELKIKYTTTVDESTTHILLTPSKNNDTTWADYDCIFVSEAALIQFLDQHESFASNDNKHLVYCGKVQDLVLSMEEANFGLALELMSSEGVVQELMTELFIIHKFAQKRIHRNKARRLLMSNADLPTQAALKKRIPITEERRYYQGNMFHTNIDAYVNGTNLDAAKIAYAAFKHNGIGLGYALSFGSKAFQSKVLAEQIQDQRFILPYGQWMPQFPSALFAYKDLVQISLNGSLAGLLCYHPELEKSVSLIDLPFELFPKLEVLELTGARYAFNVGQIPAFLSKLPHLRRLKVKAYQDAREAFAEAAPDSCVIEFL
ncbi:MAG: leucine-rich repeat domain-containing protein [Saprospiraceae bacterium]|nr:leucine-rich repeat domain-containing protein [Saprospiraceae bacterium]